MWCVYIIKSKKDKSIYIGRTNNPQRRILEHNSGKTFSTRRKRPWELIYCEVYKSSKDAEQREDALKLHANALSQLKRRIFHCIKD